MIIEKNLLIIFWHVWFKPKYTLVKTQCSCDSDLIYVVLCINHTVVLGENNAWNLVQTLANASTFNWASLNDPIKMFFSFEIDRVAPPLFLLVSFTNLKNAWDVNWAENKNFSVKISIFYFLLYYQRACNLNRGNLFSL